MLESNPQHSCVVNFADMYGDPKRELQKQKQSKTTMIHQNHQDTHTQSRETQEERRPQARKRVQREDNNDDDCGSDSEPMPHPRKKQARQDNIESMIQCSIDLWNDLEQMRGGEMRDDSKARLQSLVHRMDNVMLRLGRMQKEKHGEQEYVDVDVDSTEKRKAPMRREERLRKDKLEELCE